MSLDLLVVGDANPDVLVSGAPETPPTGQAETLVEAGTLALGGSAAIVAHGAARHGSACAPRSPRWSAGTRPGSSCSTRSPRREWT